MFVKIVLGAAAEKAFKKAGGLDGLTEKGKKAAQRLSEHGQNIKKAINHKSVEEGAETVGTVAGDVVDVAKDAGQVTLEIANETMGDLKNGWGRAKEIFGAAKQPKTGDTAEQDNTPYENTAKDILQMFGTGAQDAEAVNALVEYLTNGYHFTTEEADKIFEAVESTSLSATDKEKLQEAVIEQTEDTRPGRGFLMSRPHNKKTM